MRFLVLSGPSSEKKPLLADAASGGINADVDADPESSAGDKPQPTPLYRLMMDTRILLCVCAMMFANSTAGLIEPLLPKYMKDEFDANSQASGLIFAASTLTYLICSPFVGRYGMRAGRWLLMMIGMVLIAAALPLLAVPRNMVRRCHQ